MLFLEEKFTFFTNNIALQLKTSKKENRGMIQMAQRRPAGKKIPFQKDSFLQQFEKLAQSGNIMYFSKVQEAADIV